MREHRAFGAAGGAGRVKDRCKIIRPTCDYGRYRRIGGRQEQRAVVLGAERLDRPDAELVRERLYASFVLGPADYEAGLGVGQEIFELGQRVGGVERQIHGARAHAGEIKRERLPGFLHLHRDAIARLDAAADQMAGEAAGKRERFAIRDASAFGQQDQCLAVAGVRGCDRVVEMIGHGAAVRARM